MPFLVQQLHVDGSDLTTRDILYLFQEMLWLHTFDVRRDIELQQLLQARVLAVKDQNLAYSVRDIFEKIKDKPDVP